MINNDLKIIKKKYGENMAKLCRQLFPTILEEEGLLPKIFEKVFEPNRYLYNDIINNNLITDFKNYIYQMTAIQKNKLITQNKTPEELLDEAGYYLYQCFTENDIQSFKKYYAEGEEICTFKGNRLNTNYVYFAVKKDVENIKREDFPNPERQDLYGTSVISIQFTKDDAHSLSIKNRYNHTVKHPDATFSNNLDNIIPGLTYSFAKYHGMKQTYTQSSLSIPDYIKTSDNKYYKMNLKINNVYYCSNNTIIDNFKVIKYDPNKYLLIDYFIIDLENNTISTYKNIIDDSFISTIKSIQKISIKKINNQKEITISTKKGNIIITINDSNQIINYKNDFIEEIPSNFLQYNKTLEEINLPNVKKINNFFLWNNENIKNIDFPNVEEIGNNFLKSNRNIEIINIPKIRIVGDYFFTTNKKLESLTLTNLEKAGDFFLKRAINIKKVEFPKLKKVGCDFLMSNNLIKTLYLPSLKISGPSFLGNNDSIEYLYLPKIKQLGNYSLITNTTLKELDLSNLEELGLDILSCNNNITIVVSPNLKNANKKIKNDRRFIIKDSYTNDNNPLAKKSPVIKKLKKILKR